MEKTAQSAFNPLIPWIRQKINNMTLTQYQMEKIRETINYAKENSPFYKAHLKEISAGEIKTQGDVERLPFMNADDLVKNGHEILCVRPDEIQRIVTLWTSGTAGRPKRVYFTKEDQELTIDYFYHGMQCLIGKEDRLLILLPCHTPGSVGDLLFRGLERIGCEAHRFGMEENLEKTLTYLDKNKITSLVGNPVYVLKLMEAGRAQSKNIKLHSVLLSTDYVPDAIARRLFAEWDCKVYEHYGMTEMGFGGGVFCRCRQGYHMREADLYFEIVSPQGKALPDGEYGEIVFTTLTRRGMPLIRYKTGDIGRFYREKCCCGDELKLMEKVKRRIDSQGYLRNGKQIYLDELDEILFACDGITDYQASIKDGKLNIIAYVMKHIKWGDEATGDNQNLAADEKLAKSAVLRQKVSEYAGMDATLLIKEQEHIWEGPLRKRIFSILSVNNF